MRYHVYLRADLHVEVDAESPEEAADGAEAIIEKEVALAVASPPQVITVDVCDAEFQSLELR